jgi:hypothetical protein
MKNRAKNNPVRGKTVVISHWQEERKKKTIFYWKGFTGAP